MTASITIQNIGRGDSPDTTVYLETSNGLTGTADVPSLPRGQETTVRIVTDAGGNCFSPDCGLTAVVDPDQMVTEANNDNNTARTTLIG